MRRRSSRPWCLRQCCIRQWHWLAVLAVAGCGGSDTPSPTATAPPAVEAPSVVVAPVPAAAQPAVNAPPAAANVAKADAAPVAPAPPPESPADTALWQSDDFNAARKKLDPRIPEAVEKLVKRYATDPSVTELMIEQMSIDPAVLRLALKTHQEAQNDPASKLPPPIPHASAEIILRALAAATDSRAHEAVVDVVYGRRVTPLDDQRAMEVVASLWGVSKHPPANDLLFQMLIDPTSFRGAKPEESNPNLQRPITSEALQRLVWQHSQSNLTAEMRLKLTDHLAKKTTSKSEHELFDSTVLDRRLENIDPWLKILGNRGFDDASRQKVENYLSSDARWLTYELLGVPVNADGNCSPTISRTTSTGEQAVILGGSTEAAPLQALPEMPPEQFPAFIAQRLWKPEVLDQFYRRAGNSPGRFIEMARVLSRFPTDSSRKLMFAASQRLGPKVVLSSAGDVPSQAHMIYDPGLLPIMKQVPRDEDPAVRDHRVGKVKKQNPKAKKPKDPGTPPAVDAKLKSRYDWMLFNEALVKTWNDRFRAAIAFQAQEGRTSCGAASCATNSATTDATESPQDGSADPAATAESPADAESQVAETEQKAVVEQKAASSTEASDVDGDPFGAKLEARTAGAQLPIELHKGAEVAAHYRVSLPDDIAGRLPGVQVDPLVIHYVCIDETNRPTALLGHYREQLKGAKVRPLEAQGRWIDYLGPGSQPGRKRSVDVMITLRDPAAAAAAAAAESDKDKDKPRKPEALRIEILCVEINQPEGESLAGGN